jgi:hypothetical protein
MLKSIGVLVCAFGCSAAFDSPRACASGTVVQQASAGAVATLADDAPIAVPPPDAVEDAWPRVFRRDSGSITVYPPTLKSWTGDVVSGVCAIAVASPDGKSQTYGTMAFTAATMVNKLNRVVELSGVQITGVSLPENPAGQTAIQQALAGASGSRVVRVGLDRFEAAVPGMSAAPSAPAAELRNDCPEIRIATTPTVLVPVQGEPVLAPFQNTTWQRVLNTPMLLMRAPRGAFWLKIADGWMTASSFAGPWSVGTATDPALVDATAWALKQPSVNLLAPGSADAGAKTVSLRTLAPEVVVSTRPMEILVTDGAPSWQPLGDSGLLYASNTSAHIFQLRSNMALYVLISGRWFTAAAPGGPWSYVPAAELPAEFRMIPRESAKENVLASVPGTQQAQESLIANSVPQMAKVPLTQTMPLPAVGGGSPRWQTIAVVGGGVAIEVLQNCSTPVFRTGPTSYFSVVNGVWFTAVSLAGPWKVATAVPAEIYLIPPSSPYYYATFVRIYIVTPEYVVMGYTPGYFGAYAQGGVVVYGTGYAYAPYCETVWVPAPWTYGCGASMYYSPWGSWAYGFGCGLAVGWAIGESNWCCGPYPYWGPYATAYGAHGAYAWGPGGWAATTGNCYQHWNGVTTMTRSSAGYNAWTGNAWATNTASSYNSVTGARSAGQRGYVENAYTGNWADGARGAGYNPTTGNYAAGKGVVVGDSQGNEAAAGRATVGNTATGRSATVTGATDENGSWGAVNTESGGAVAHDGNVYGMHDGNAYHYNDSTGTWQRYDSGSWTDVKDEQMVQSLNDQAAARSNGDRRTSNSSRWQSGGEGFTGRQGTSGTRSGSTSTSTTTTRGGNWGGRTSGGGGRGGRR